MEEIEEKKEEENQKIEKPVVNIEPPRPVKNDYIDLDPNQKDENLKKLIEDLNKEKDERKKLYLEL